MANSNGWGDGASNNLIGWGQGANNIIGWGSVYAESSAGLTDITGIVSAPVCEFAPVISGSTSVGSTLTVTDNGGWTGNPTPTFSYQWKRGATNIGTNATTYILVVADTNENITCVVTGTNAIGFQVMHQAI